MGLFMSRWFVQDEEEDVTEFEKLLGDYSEILTDRKYKVWEEVNGVVVSGSKDSLFVDLGTKKLGIVSKEEFLANNLSLPEYGTEVSFFVKEDNGSELVLTKFMKQKDLKSSFLKDAFRSSVPVEGVVESFQSSGFQVRVGGTKGFVPISHMSLNRVEDGEGFVGKTYLFHIIEFKPPANLVLSRKKLLEQEKTIQAQSVLSDLKEGEMRRVKISRILDHGAFASLGGVEGYIPIQELSWTRIKSPKEVIKEGEEVTVKVISIQVDEAMKKPRISLSLKQASEDPWTIYGYRLNQGVKVEGKVVHIIPQGCFLRLDPEMIEGFVPISELSEDRVKSTEDVVKVGQSVTAWVKDLDLNQKKITLTLKEPFKRVMVDHQNQIFAQAFQSASKKKIK